MSVAAIVTGGLSPGGSIPWLLTEGFGFGAVSAGAIGKKAATQWYTLPNGMRIRTTPERYKRLIVKPPEAVQEVPAEQALEREHPGEVGKEPIRTDGARPEPETYEGPLLGIAPKSEIELPKAEEDIRASLAAKEAAERLAREQFERENLEEEEAIILELIMKDLLN